MAAESPSLTGKQRLALKRIVESIATRGYPPTIRELARSLNVTSPNAVVRYLDALEKRGYIRRRGGARSITIPKEVTENSKGSPHIELGERGIQAFASWLPGLTPRQREIMQRLHSLPAPELAKLYYAAVRLLSDRHNPARVYLVAHCVREIGNSLPDHLSEVPVRKHVEYSAHLDQIASRWDKMPRPPLDLPTSADGAAAEVPIPLDLFRMISGLVQDHLMGTSTHRARAERVFSSLDEGMSADKAHLTSLTERWRNVVEWFVRRVHVKTATELPPSAEVQECERQFRLFENVIYSSLHPFFVPMEKLDEILEDANK